jgi:hypothetical protein
MKENRLLVVTVVLSVLLVTLHLADDVVYGFESGGVSYLIAMPVLVVWLYGGTVLAGRRSGCVIVILGSLLGMAVPFLHMRHNGVSDEIARSSGGFFFIWTLIALGVTALFSLILALRELLSSRRPTAD